MKDLYIASTLKSDWNRKFNPLICKELEKRDVVCHLPQRDTKQDGTELDKYNQNIKAITDSKKFLSIGINISINLGIETGFTFGIKKPIILLTDKNTSIPVMSLGMYNKIIRVDNIDNIDDYIEEVIEAVKNE